MGIRGGDAMGRRGFFSTGRVKKGVYMCISTMGKIVETMAILCMISCGKDVSDAGGEGKHVNNDLAPFFLLSDTGWKPVKVQGGALTSGKEYCITITGQNRQRCFIRYSLNPKSEKGKGFYFFYNIIQDENGSKGDVDFDVLYYPNNSQGARVIIDYMKKYEHPHMKNILDKADVNLGKRNQLDTVRRAKPPER